MTSSIDNDALQITVAALRRGCSPRGTAGLLGRTPVKQRLSTATAVFALATVDGKKHRSLIDRGLRWLCKHQNADGGWGDTVQSPSNLSTTMLCYSALAIADCGLRIADCGVDLAQRESAIRNPQSAICATVHKAESWLRRKVGSLEPQALAKAVERQYGKDRTFSVPILTMCALAGRLGAGRAGMAAGPAAALRAGGPAASPVQVAAAAGRQLRLARTDRHRPGPIRASQAPQSADETLRHLSASKSLDVLTRLSPPTAVFWKQRR